MVASRRSTRLAHSTGVTQVSTTSQDDPDTQVHEATTAPARKRRRKTMEAEGVPAADKAEPEPTASKPKRKKAAAEAELTPEDCPPRITNLWKIGPHVSAAGGVENAIINAARIGANAFGLFVKSQRKWTSPPMSEESVSLFKSRMKAFGYSSSHVLPHGSYLINLGNPDKEKREKSYECFLDDLQRCEQLGLELYNFHPGSTVGQATREESVAHIAECLNRAHKATTSIITVIENMAGAGNIIGSAFQDLADIIRLVEDKGRVGVCLDTCHMYAAGYDITTAEGWSSVVSDFDQVVGISYLKGLHMNDSKAALGSKRDRHENIGLGHLGMHTFHYILTDPRTQNMPIILETPSNEGIDIWRTEVASLNRLSGSEQDAGELEKELTAEIKAVVAKNTKDKPKPNGKKAAAGASRKRKAVKDEDGADDAGSASEASSCS